MKAWASIMLALLALSAHADIPYPIIFVHGLTGDYRTFQTCIEDLQSIYGLPEPVVYHMCLNHDQNDETATMAGDVVGIGFTAYGGNLMINPPSDCRLFAVNFDDDEFQNVGGHGDHNGSNQAAIFKQGYALSLAIAQVRAVTGLDKVIVVGHSMGGLAIREYLQRTTMLGGPHRWWADPNQADGHHVAQVVTTGTPHLGSNAGLDDPTLLTYDSSRDIGPWEINNESESLRDLRYQYDNYPECQAEDPVGIYLFGGNEHCLYESAWNIGRYDNADIDCDGDENDLILGIDSGSGDNPLMPLPTNLWYNWIVNDSDFGESSWQLFWCNQQNVQGDGLVLLSRQWLYTTDWEPLPSGVSDVLQTGDTHVANWCDAMGEGDDVVSLARGLDEPGIPALALPIDLGRSIKGLVTLQPNWTLQDMDCFRVTIPHYGTLGLTLTGGSGIVGISILSASGQLLAEDTGPPFQLDSNLLVGTYTLRVLANPSESSWLSPYTLSTSWTPIVMTADFTAAPLSGQVPLTVQFTDASTGLIVQRSWDFNNDGVTDSQAANPSWTYQAPGIYSVRLTVTDLTYTAPPCLRTNYIQVGANPGPTVRPAPVDDLTIQLVDADTALLSWSPITIDVDGNSITCVYYDVYHGATSDFTLSAASRVGTTSATSIQHDFTGDAGFYRVTVQSCQSWQGLDMVTIPAGTFIMGPTYGFEPEHQVTLTHNFLLSRTEITNEQFMNAAQWAVDNGHAWVSLGRLRSHSQDLLDMTSSYCEIAYEDSTEMFSMRRAQGAGDWGFSESGTYDPAEHPVKVVSWYGAACYCDWLSLRNGLAAYYNGNWSQIPSPDIPYMATGYRLPTEAEREFAAQYDDERTYPWGNATPTCNYANYWSCVAWSSPVATHPAGATVQGLQDMAGNLFEWCNDWYESFPGNPVTDPPGPASGYGRVIKGGSWSTSAQDLYCSNRWGGLTPSTMGFQFGFRLCRTLP